MSKKYNIKEVAKLFNITTNKIRYYEKQELIKPIRDEENDYRIYSGKDIMQLQAVLLYRSIGLSIKTIKEIIKRNDGIDYLEHFNRQWIMVNDEIHRLNTIRESLEKIIDTLYEDEKMNSDKIFPIIEEGNKVASIREGWKDKWNFNSWADSYDEDVKVDRGALKIYENYNKVLNKVYEKSTITGENISVLDIGVGTGNLAKKFLENNYRVVGIDQSREMLRVAKHKYPNLKVRLGEFLKIPFNDKVFDIIVSTYAFHHLNSEEKSLAIKEMIRVLKDNGKIVIGDLMFKNRVEEEWVLKELTEVQVDEIKDEYYSYIDELESEFMKYNKKLNYEKIDRFISVIEVN
ncbi:methyltransferase domain-containing protein [Clostridium paraputrificum]|uniref:Methyltransferase n=1 Tax=Clostridium paraputrificum TaxID=29363 RepID=A0A174WL76_9CLOT|nr:MULTISPECIES: methyltransferase domain-containing protein [Clostridium]MDB2088639.1 methyltransferase domain-containing protein [Clostridium paraputrificum]MDB2096281.1 methyltransferase domain-containing protein [Clostridium paraputrificum]MDB2122409.1 methyltransferase domain-containing protein [Clostridium paraputrificum]MDU1178554.1 methyltransferase domain-containing protein [Clostridium sp.]MDU1225921.1 methyltransferase domain-containing protein [Clostridium sp.]